MEMSACHYIRNSVEIRTYPVTTATFSGNVNLRSVGVNWLYTLRFSDSASLGSRSSADVMSPLNRRSGATIDPSQADGGLKRLRSTIRLLMRRAPK